jgi:hypothetical protein
LAALAREVAGHDGNLLASQTALSTINLNWRNMMKLLLPGTKARSLQSVRLLHFVPLPRISFAALFIGTIVSLTNASVVFNDAAISQGPFGNQLTLTQSIPPGMGLFAIGIEDLGRGNYRFSYSAIAEFYSLHNATFGLAFTPAYVNGHIPLVSNDGINPGTAVLNFLPDESKYFAYWDDRTLSPFNTALSNDNYGWVRITRTGSALVASESVTAIGGGIRVGTSTQIPEPSAISLLLVAGVFRAAKRRERKRSIGALQRP